MIEIKHKDTGEVLHRIEADTLVGADLSGRDLRGASLHDTDLTEANLSGAIVIEADFAEANLSHSHATRANFSRANFSGAGLAGANLIGANLIGASFYGADLTDAYLGGADLSYSNLADAVLLNANLNGATLRGASLRSTILDGAFLKNAYLSGVVLEDPYLGEVDMTGVVLSNAIFSDCSTLHLAKGLEAVRHNRPSILDARTLRTCVNDLPDVFLQGVGYNAEEIRTLRKLYATFSYFSCFLSYAHVDAAFVDKLYSDLQAQGVNCWKDTEDLRGGEFWRKQIRHAVKEYDKVLIICSEAALSRPNVVEEVVEAMEAERAEAVVKLFPVRLDDFLFSPEAQARAHDTLPPQYSREDWLSYLNAFHVFDFRQWQDEAAYQKALQKLLRDLKNPEKR